MMGWEEDSNFEDNEFLQGVFESADMKNIEHTKTTTCIQHNYNPGMHSSPMKSTNENAFEENISTGRYENKSKIDKNQIKKPTPKFIGNKDGCMDKFASDDSFEFEDDFPFDNFYTEEKDNINPCTSTPPDSEFTQILNPKINNQVQINNNVKVSSASSTDIVRKNNFRYRLLQTLRENKIVSSVSHIATSQSPHSQTASSSKSPEYMLGNGLKRPSVQHSNINEEDDAPLVKKQYTKSNIPSNSVTENFSTPRTFNDTAGQKRHTQTLPVNNNQFKTNTPQEIHPSRYQQPPAPSTTPVKPPVKGLRKTVSPGGPVIRKRKFPGPAGILPQLGSNVAVPSIQELHEKTAPSSVVQDVVCSQNSVDDFSRGPWQQMINDLELDQTDPESPLRVFNIKWVLRRASLRGQAGVRKVPFLAVIVHSLDATCTDATAVLKDPTGEMNGTIASSVMDEYGPSLQPGSVLLLRGVTVLSPVGLRAAAGLREHNRRHYLNITLNTVLTIYTPDESGHVFTTSIEKVDKRELCKQAAAPETAGGPRAIVEEEEEEGHGDISVQNHSLFSSVNDSHGQFKESASSPRIPNYRCPRSASNNIVPCSSGQPQKLNQRYPPVSNMQQHTGHLGNNIPRITPSNFNGKVMSPRPPTTVPLLQPQFHQSPNQPVVPATCNRPSGSSTNTFSEKIKSLPKCNFFYSQAEEKEVNDLLDGVDADSLFGDF